MMVMTGSATLHHDTTSDQALPRAIVTAASQASQGVASSRGLKTPTVKGNAEVSPWTRYEVTDH